MFGTQLLDIAIGLVFTYTILSLITSALVELLEAGLRTRAKYLWQGIGELLQDRPPNRRPGTEQPTNTSTNTSSPKNTSLTLHDFYTHPLIGGLYYGNYDTATGRLFRRALPAYIPRADFAAVLIEIISRPNRGRDVSTIESFRRGVEALHDHRLRPGFEAILAVAGDDLSAVQKGLESWYDDAMDRVSGWYKRHAQAMLLLFGLVVASSFNADTFKLVVHLNEDEPAREALVSAASSFVSANQGKPPDAQLKDIDSYVGQIRTKGSPLGKQPTFDVASFLGFLVTAFAISLGAPFWFDLLNRLSVIRATVKPKEKSGDEASEERQASVAGSTKPRATSVMMRG